MKDKRIVDLISYHAAYVFEEVAEKGRKAEKQQNVLLGSSIMEGSKAGATAAAVCGPSVSSAKYSRLRKSDSSRNNHCELDH